MTSISGAGALGAPQDFQAGRTDSQTRIRFENTLAAVRSSQSSDGQNNDHASTAPQVAPSAESILAQGPIRRPVPAQKVIASLTHLIQQNKTGSGLDVIH